AAASDWDEPVQRKIVSPALEGSVEALFHEIRTPRFFLPLRAHEIPESLERRRLERAIGVIYRPETERFSHYFHGELPRQFVARVLNENGFATLLMDLLTIEEEEDDQWDAHLRFDIELLKARLIGATDWLLRNPETRRLTAGYFGASTGAGAALKAAPERPE